MSRIGTQIDKYELRELLAVGGQAEVYRGVLLGAKNYSKTVAIKRILSQSSMGPSKTKYFEREAHLCALLNHPNLVQTFDFIQKDSDLYLVMEFIHGKNLKEVESRARDLKRPLTTEGSLFIISQACLGLDYAHQKTDDSGTPLNIIHRDMSPHNIMITYDGLPKVVDFGVAQASDLNEKTATGMFLGKLAYMSPEQISAQRLDARTDVFSLGLVLYELLAGKRAYSSDNPPQLFDAVRECRIPPLSDLGIMIHPTLENILSKALAKLPSERFVSAGDFGEAIHQYASSLESYSSLDLGFLMKSLFSNEIETYQQRSKVLNQNSKIKAPPPIPTPRIAHKTLSSSGKRSTNWGAMLMVMGLALVAWQGWLRFLAFQQTNLEHSTGFIVTAKPSSPKANNRQVTSTPPSATIEDLHAREFLRMQQLVWAQPKPWYQNLDPNGSDSLDFIIARWHSSPASKLVFGYGDANHPIKTLSQPCLVSSGKGCGPMFLKGQAPFQIALKLTPRPDIDINVYLSPEDCNHLGNNARLSEDGTCYFTLAPGRHNIGLHVSRKE